MNCHDIHNDCDAWLDHELSDTRTHALEAHLQSCPACRQYVQRAREIRDALPRLHAPAMSPEFASRAFDKARQQARTTGSPRRNLALAASLAVAGMVGLFLHQLPETTAPESAAIEISLQQPREVNLVFNARENLDQVSIRIELSDNLALDGFAGKRIVSWNTSLQKGKNVLSLPIIATQSGRGTVITRLQLGDQYKTFLIHVDARSHGSTQIQNHRPHNLVQT